MKLPSLGNGCIGKINLGKNYVKDAERLAKKHNKCYGVYWCPHCSGFHVTTKIANQDSYSPLLHITENK